MDMMALSDCAMLLPLFGMPGNKREWRREKNDVLPFHLQSSVFNIKKSSDLKLFAPKT
jgi:hypothetical protein